MVEFFPQENPKVVRLNTLKVGDCFSVEPVGDENFEIFIIVRSKINAILKNTDEISVVSLKTGILCLFPKEFAVYPLDLQVYYSHQWLWL